MNRREFIDGLRTALEGKISSSLVQEQINYYSGYIEEELRKGKTEEEILAELGDPWLVAKNLEDVYGENAHSEESFVDIDVSSEKEQKQHGKAYTFTSGSGMGCWLLAFALMLCLFTVLYVISGIFKLLSPILVPILLAVFIVRLFKKR